MLWLKAFHIVFVVCWFAGIFYLPRLFVYHAMTEDTLGKERFKVMERKLYRGIMTPSAVVAITLGVWQMALMWPAIAQAGWIWVKIALVVVLIAHHLYCGKMVAAFATDRNPHSHTFYRWFNDLPLLVLIAIVVLAVVRPF